MDWYLIGRIIGAIVWPLAAAFAIYGIGWLIALQRPPHVAGAIKSWFRFAAVLGFIATLFVTAREFLRHTGGS